MRCGHKQITWIKFEAGGICYCETCRSTVRIAKTERVELV